MAKREVFSIPSQLSSTGNKADPSWNQGQFSTCVVFSTCKALAAALKDYHGLDVPAERIKSYVMDAGGVCDPEYIERIRVEGTNEGVLLDFINKLLALEGAGGIDQVRCPMLDGAVARLRFRIGYLYDEASPLDLAKQFAKSGQLNRCVIGGHRVQAGLHGNHAMHGEAISGDKVICNNSWGDSNAVIDVGPGGVYPNLTSICHVAVFDVAVQTSAGGNWKPIDCPGPIQCSAGFGLQQEPCGAKYAGQWSSHEKHGHGKYVWPSGDSYDGEWRKDKIHGHGKNVWADRYYDGEWLDGKLHGKGKFVWASGDSYDGEWRKGTKHGHGKHVGPSGSSYDGEWLDDERHGKGKHVLTNGDSYDGEWRKGKKHGKAKYVGADGSSYDGEWLDGKHHGKGKHVLTNGDSYDGEWRKGKKHGKGKYVGADGSSFDGEWRDGDRVDGCCIA